MKSARYYAVGVGAGCLVPLLLTRLGFDFSLLGPPLDIERLQAATGPDATYILLRAAAGIRCSSGRPPA